VSRKWTIYLSLIHGVFLTFLSIYLQKLPWTVQGEDTLIQWSIILKRNVFDPGIQDHHGEFLFVNTSYSNQLVDKFDEEGFPLGNQVITDRFQLAMFLAAMNRLDNYEWVLVDVFFETESEADSLLRPEIEQLDRALMSTTTSDKGQKLQPIFDNQTGLANIETLDDIFLKYRLIHYDSLKAIPLKMYEALTDKDYQKRGFLVHGAGKWGLNYYIPDIRISQYNVVQDREYPLVNLSDLTFLDDQALSDLIADRIVVIGDFLANDNVETLTGQIAGPLLLTNVYLSLRHGDHLLSWPYLLFLYVLFSLISLLVFMPDDLLRRKIVFRNILVGGSFIVYLAIVSLLSYLFFNKALNVFMLSFYLIAANYFVEKWWKKHKKSRNKSHGLPSKI